MRHEITHEQERAADEAHAAELRAICEQFPQCPITGERHIVAVALELRRAIVRRHPHMEAVFAECGYAC